MFLSICHLSVDMSVFLCVRVDARACMCVFASVHVCGGVHMCMCVSARARVCVCVCVQIKSPQSLTVYMYSLITQFQVDGVRNTSLTVHISNDISSVECCLEGAGVQSVSGTIPDNFYCLTLNTTGRASHSALIYSSLGASIAHW